MIVCVTTELRLMQTPDGRIWTSSVGSYSFWQRYLGVFEAVRVLGRAQIVQQADPAWQRVDGECVTVVPIPYYIGPRQYLMKFRQVHRAIHGAFAPDHAVILRLPSQIGSIAARDLERKQHPFGAEIVGDPYDTFSPGAVQHPLRASFRWSSVRALRQQCAKAAATSYVTESALQRRYPPAPGTFTTHYSSIQLEDSAFVPQPRVYNNTSQPITLICVGTLEQLYKGQDVLIDAVSQCIKQGFNLRLVLVGEGAHRAALEAHITDLGMSDHIRCIGAVAAGEAVRAQLDAADVFVLPSRQEGLPRAMIEAMARALPCIGSTVGGIPELLPPDDLVLPNDVEALAQKIHEVITNPARMTAMSARNLAKAHDYSEDKLNARRHAFYRVVHQHTESWLKGHS